MARKFSRHGPGSPIEITIGRLAKYDALVAACVRLRTARDSRRRRTAAFQLAASEARKGGPRGAEVTAAIERKHPVAYDLSDIADDICEALDALTLSSKS